MDHHRWLTALVAARKAGGISDRTLGVAVLLGSVVNWSRPEPGIYWSTAALLAETGLQRDAFYRARKELLEAGLMADIKGTLCCICATDRGVSATDRRNSATHMNDALDDAQRVTASTSSSEIEARYPDAATDPQQFANALAETLTVAILNQWPDSPDISTWVLVRLFADALRTYPRDVLFDAVGEWLASNAGSTSMRKPVAVFHRQAWDLFAAAAARYQQEAK